LILDFSAVQVSLALGCMKAPQRPPPNELQSGRCKVWYVPDEQDPGHGLLAEVFGAGSTLIGAREVEGPTMNDDGSVLFKEKEIGAYTKAGVLEIGDVRVEVEGRDKDRDTITTKTGKGDVTFHFNSACESRELALGSAGLLVWMEIIVQRQRQQWDDDKKKQQEEKKKKNSW